MWYYTFEGTVEYEDVLSGYSRLSSASINLNYSEIGSTASNKWSAVAAHEMDHVLGLMHHNTSCIGVNDASIMWDGSNIYYLSMGLSTPSLIDRTNVEEYYELVHTMAD